MMMMMMISEKLLLMLSTCHDDDDKWRGCRPSQLSAGIDSLRWTSRRPC